MDSEKFIKEFQLILQEHSLSSKKVWWEKYMKNEISFRGVGLPQIRKLLKEWYIKKDLQNEDLEDQIILAREFISQTIAEDKLAGILLLQEFVIGKLNCEKLVCNVEDLFNRNYIFDRNTCDWLCVKILTPVVEKGRLVCVQQITNWRKSSNLWKARASAVSFAQAYNIHDHLDFVNEKNKTLIRREERFAKTAVAWVLREVSRLNPKYTLKFVNQNLPLFTRETILNSLKYYEPDIKKDYLKQLKNG